MRKLTTGLTARAGFTVQTSGPSERISMSIRFLLALMAFAANYLFAVLYNSQIIKFAGGDLFEYLNRAYYLVAGATLLAGILLGEIRAVMISFLIFVYMAVMTVVGSQNTVVGYVNSLFLVYAALACAPVAAYLFRTARGNAVEVVIKCVLTMYFLLYVYFSLTVSEGSARAISGSGFIVASGDRGPRIALDAAAVATGCFLSLTGLRAGRFTISNMVLLLLSAFSIYLSSSRLFSLVMVLISVWYLIFGIRNYLEKYLLRVFLLICAVMIVSAIFDGNMYSYLSFDSSGYARMREMETIKDVFWQNAAFGKGLFSPRAADPLGIADFSSGVFWNDMGIYGVLYATGIVGLIVFLALSILAIRSRRIFAEAGLDPTFVDGLSLASITIGAFGVFAPNLWTSGFELLAFIVAAMVVRRRGPARGVRSVLFPIVLNRSHQ